MPKSNVQHAAGVDATLNGPGEVTLYHPNGKTIRVEQGDLPFWLDQGFRQTVADPKATAAELKAVFPAALDAIMDYVKGVTKDGEIDPSDNAAQAVAYQAMRKLETLWGQLVRDIEAQYGVKQGDAIAMLDADDQPRDVDPAQVEHYQAQGWTKA